MWRRFALSAAECEERKNPKSYGKAPLQSIVVNGPLEMMAMDVLGPLPRTARGNEYILVVMDYFTKWPEVYPISDQKAGTICECLRDVVATHGAPRILLSDQGRNFESEMIKELCAAYGIDKRRTTPLHPQCDGMVERFNKTLAIMLTMYVNEQKDDWDYWLPEVTFAYRSSVHSSTGYSPYEVMYGRQPYLPADLMFQLEIMGEGDGSYYERLKVILETVKEKVSKRIRAAQKSQKKQYDKTVKFRAYEVGERVRVYNPACKKGQPSKLTGHWKGPYTVIGRLSELTYIIKQDLTEEMIRAGKSAKTTKTHFNRMKLSYTPPPCKQVEQIRRKVPTLETVEDTQYATLPKLGDKKHVEVEDEEQGTEVESSSETDSTEAEQSSDEEDESSIDGTMPLEQGQQRRSERACRPPERLQVGLSKK
jgi:Integrase core domain